MKRNSDSLFLLIRSMSKSEKRYFKLYSSAFKKESYLIRLYDIIEKEKEYTNEEKILSEFKSVCNGKDFYGTKKKLYEQLIKSLRIYHSATSAENQTNVYIHNSQILFQKKLIKECSIELNKAIDLAHSFELFLPLLHALELESRVNVSKEFNFAKKEIVLKRESAREEILRKYHNYNKYLSLESYFVALYAKYPFVRDRQAENAYGTIMNEPLLKEEHRALSVRAKIVRSNILCGYYYARGDFERSYLNAGKMVSEIESRKGYEKVFQGKYTIALGNAGKCLLHLKRNMEISPIIKKLMEIKAYDNAIAIKSLELQTAFEIALLMDSGDFKSALARLPQVEKKFTRYFVKLGEEHQHVIMYNTVYAYFGIGNYTGALRSLNKLLFFSGIEKNQNIYYFAQIMNLVIHFEKSNMDHVEHKLKSISGYFQARKNSHKYEFCILQLIESAIYINDPNELLSLFTVYKRKLQDILKDPFEKVAIEYFDVISWLESKIAGKSFAEVVKSKWEKAR